MNGPLSGRRIASLSIGGESDFSAALVLFFGTARYCDGTHDAAAFDDG